ncbi:type I-C CRISPR-associated protein Cas8c/Csd1 [Sphingomonas pituitosa]|uniref:type I-C CRISPR-associated protein Cas8c/Csd1 n=1 Tax=Sphingomonas pituitosa TaxID=99597 RepID=UPI00082D9D75|nr:type I-C CRISPR-associated protein Cas8c/Csd1 [Sphingomonas pituitosa]
MTILQALHAYYDRLDDIAAPGWSQEKFGWCIVLSPEGDAIDVENLHDLTGKKPKPTLRVVPAAVKRTVAIAPNFLWDKTAYVLGRTAGEGKRTADEHAAFVALHLDRLAGQEDAGLAALRRFLERWRPDQFEALPRGSADMLDANVMFRLDGEHGFLHERPAARALVEAAGSPGTDDRVGSLCLVTGELAPVTRLHPTIKGVEGAQSSGAALVSFNLDAFTSFGKEQGENAPTSEGVAFRYGAALNRMLQRDSGNRLSRPIGDATVVFWADASKAETEAADAFMALLMEPDAREITDEKEVARLRTQIEQIAAGRPVAELRPDIGVGTRFHVLGLSPNAARISIRFWLSGALDQFAAALARHYQAMRIEPLPRNWGAAPSVRRLLAQTVAAQGEMKNVPALLAGEVMRAVLSGGAYPQSLLAAVLMRLRAGDSAAFGWHAAVIRGVLMRDPAFVSAFGEPPMSLQRDYAEPGYQLGRLFAVYELAQRAALGRVNASIRDKYFGAASATPASVFPIIVRGGQNHLAKVRKEKPGWATLIERELEEIHSHLDPALPRSLSLQKQGAFAIGYYHQRATRLSSDKVGELDPTALTDSEETEGEA